MIMQPNADYPSANISYSCLLFFSLLSSFPIYPCGNIDE